MSRPQLALLLVLCAPAPAAATCGKVDVTASHVHKVRVYRNPGNVTFETYDLVGAGADTVMHLLNSNNQEVKMNDDCSPRHKESCFTYNVPAAGWYLVVIRSYSTATGGNCSLKVNGAPVEQSVPFGGAHVDTNTISADVVQTAFVNQGTTDTVLYGLDAAGHIIGIDDDAGVGWASRLAGAFAKVVVGTYGWTAGAARVYVNDAWNDHDGDGLGAQLESALCICDSITATPPSGTGCPAVPCQPPYTRHPEDSDGDGIRDDYEALGVDGTDAYDYPQHLLRWGANTAHKDIFVEMDKDQPPAPDHLTADQALTLAQAYNRAASASSVKNRDGADGIAGTH